MFFYNQKYPTKNTIVIANMKLGDKNDNCMYVTLPEYNNINGILYRNELPKRLKLQKKAIADMKQAGQIVCVVTNTPIINQSSNIDIVELSVKGVDAKFHDALLSRYRNIEKLLKIVKFISIKFNMPYYELVKNLQKSIIFPLNDIDEDNGVDNFEVLYSSCLRDIGSLLKFVPLEDDIRMKVIETLTLLIKETNASSTLNFNLTVWHGDYTGRNDVTILQSVFRYIKEKFMEKTVDIRYGGAPKYQIIIRSVAIDNIDTLYSDIKTSMIEWMTDNNITRYDLQFDISQKEVVHGDVVITYPFQVDMID
jgi:translation initiation factor 2 alpha subunit (eIF-2alpha)